MSVVEQLDIDGMRVERDELYTEEAAHARVSILTDNLSTIVGDLVSHGSIPSDELQTVDLSTPAFTERENTTAVDVDKFSFMLQGDGLIFLQFQHRPYVETDLIPGNKVRQSGMTVRQLVFNELGVVSAIEFTDSAQLRTGYSRDIDIFECAQSLDDALLLFTMGDKRLRDRNIHGVLKDLTGDRASAIENYEQKRKDMRIPAEALDDVLVEVKLPVAKRKIVQSHRQIMERLTLAGGRRYEPKPAEDSLFSGAAPLERIVAKVAELREIAAAES